MGCLKLPYCQEGVKEENTNLFWEVHSKKGSGPEKRVKYLRYGYQGQFAEEDEETGWNSFELRMYDVVIGRWISTDPYGQYWSPYMGMGNNPINQIDPDGAYSKIGALWRSGFGLRGSIYQSGVDGGREVWGFNSGGKAYFGDDARNFYQDGPVIQAKKPNFFEELKNNIDDVPMGGDIAGGFLYNMTDELYVSAMQVGKNRYHLDGSSASRDEITDAGVNTLLSALPVSKITSPILKGVNAAKFSQITKGTIISRLSPKLRGFMNKQFNRQVVKKQIKLIYSGTGAGAKGVDWLFNDN